MMASNDSSSPALLLTPSSSSTLLSHETTLVQVHPLVLLSVLDHHTRRQEGAGRVIGTLLGRRDTATGAVEVTNCFAVPHAEQGDQVAIGKDFNRQMLALHTRANRKEVVVGWYATALPPQDDDAANEADATATANANAAAAAAKANEPMTQAKRLQYKCIADTSSLIHEFYAGECGSTGVGTDGVVAAASGAGDPIHLVLDTSLAYDTIGLRAYKSTPITIRGEPFANMFHEIRVQVKSSESERICVDKMIASMGVGLPSTTTTTTTQDENGDNHTNTTNTTTSPLEEDPTQALQTSMTKLLHLLESSSTYVNQIVDGSLPMPSDDVVGRKLYDALASVPRIRKEVFEEMFHDNLQDLLMVSYLSHVTKTQLVIAEKLNETLTLGM